MSALGSVSVPSLNFGTGAGTFMQGIVDVVLELLRTFPDVLVIGSGFFALITVNAAYGILFLTFLLATFFTWGVQYFTKFVGFGDKIPTGKDFGQKCRSGFSSRTLESLSLFKSNTAYAFPSAPIFMVTVGFAYMFGSLMTMQNELTALGPAYASRFNISMIFGVISIFAYSVYRFYNGCDGAITAFGSIFIGLLFGFIMLRVNYSLFGKQSVNLIGVPLLNGKAVNGLPIYICPTSTATSS
jgi:hypothetical protein